MVLVRKQDARSGTPAVPLLFQHRAHLAGQVFHGKGLGDEVEGFRNLAHASNRQWYERVARAILRDHPNTAIPFEVALFASYALGSMMDELARKLVILPDPAFVSLTRMIAPNREVLAQLLSVMWHHALYGAVPDQESLPRSAREMAALVGG